MVRNMVMTSFWCFLLLTSNIFHIFFYWLSVDFEQVNIRWEVRHSSKGIFHTLELSYSGKTKFSVRKTTSTFGLSTAVTQQFSECVGKKWKSAWVVLSSEIYSCFTIDRIYWKRNPTAIEVLDNPKVLLETGSYILIVKEDSSQWYRMAQLPLNSHIVKTFYSIAFELSYRQDVL